MFLVLYKKIHRIFRHLVLKNVTFFSIWSVRTCYKNDLLTKALGKDSYWFHASGCVGLMPIAADGSTYLTRTGCVMGHSFLVRWSFLFISSLFDIKSKLSVDGIERNQGVGIIFWPFIRNNLFGMGIFLDHVFSRLDRTWRNVQCLPFLQGPHVLFS